MSFHNIGGLMWIMLHSFAEKIKPEAFTDNKTEIIDFLRDFYNNELPCDHCRVDCINYLNIYDALNTQLDLKKYLFDFHQSVNRKLRKKFQDETILLQYETVNITEIFSLYITKCRTETVKTFLTTHDSWFN